MLLFALGLSSYQISRLEIAEFPDGVHSFSPYIWFQRSWPIHGGTVRQKLMLAKWDLLYPASLLFVSVSFLPRVSSQRLNLTTKPLCPSGVLVKSIGAEFFLRPDILPWHQPHVWDAVPIVLNMALCPRNSNNTVIQMYCVQFLHKTATLIYDLKHPLVASYDIPSIPDTKFFLIQKSYLDFIHAIWRNNFKLCISKSVDL